MNKKGFTLVELIAVIALIALIAIIATPNIVRMVDSGKKETFVTNAKNMISKAKYRNKLEKYDNLFITNGNCRVIKASNLGMDFEPDPDGNLYDLENSQVKACLENNTFVFYVKTIPITESGSGRGIYSTTNIDNFVTESELSTNSVINIP